jgi:hypothetical protein
LLLDMSAPGMTRQWKPLLTADCNPLYRQWNLHRRHRRIPESGLDTGARCAADRRQDLSHLTAFKQA